MKWIPRFHLSTALVMMLAAGALLGLNLRPSTHPVASDSPEFRAQWVDLVVTSSLDFNNVPPPLPPSDLSNLKTLTGYSPAFVTPPIEAITVDSVTWGFPFVFATDYQLRISGSYPSFKNHDASMHPDWHWIFDALVGMLSVAIVGFLSEWLFARRCKRPPPPL